MPTLYDSKPREIRGCDHIEKRAQDTFLISSGSCCRKTFFGCKGVSGKKNVCLINVFNLRISRQTDTNCILPILNSIFWFDGKIMQKIEFYRFLLTEDHFVSRKDTRFLPNLKDF